MVKLVCAIIGMEGSAFPVDVDASQTVGDVKKAIKAEKPNKLKDVDADDLQLFLAKKDGAWLSDNEDLDTLLQSEIDTSSYLYLRSSWKLSKRNLFGTGVSLGEDVVHVLVVVPKRSVRDLTEGRRDSSAEWLQEFHTKRIELHSLPSYASLHDFIERALPVKIGMPERLLASWSNSPVSLSFQLQDKLFEIDDESPCDRFRSRVLSDFMLEPLRSGDTESSFIWFWDTMVRAVLDFMFARARFNRDSSKSSSTGRKRPDFLFLLNDVCVFRGEEKEPGTNLRLPREELSEKLVWAYGTVPYVFAYAASGYKIDLLALCRSTGELSNVETIPIGYFDLELIPDRFRLVLALLNLSLLFSAITEACPDSGRNEYKDIYRTSGVVVRLYPKFVEKTFPNAENLDHLRQIYGVLEAAEVPNVDGIFEVKPNKKMVLLKPRGTMVKPSNLMELFVALRNVLEALVVLHRESWIHRDIRWSNVIKRRDCNTWFLIDFVDAARSPQTYPSGDHLSKEEHAPEIFVEGNTHTTAVDIWAVGYLVEESGVKWGDIPERTAFLMRLMQEDPNSRPTADEALRDLLRLEESVTQELLEKGTSKAGSRKRKHG